MTDCLTCGNELPNTGRGQRRYCPNGRCRKTAELDARRHRRLERFVGSIGPVATRDELLVLLSAAARAGSVQAVRALLQELPREQETSPDDDFIDELAKRRGPS